MRVGEASASQFVEFLVLTPAYRQAGNKLNELNNPSNRQFYRIPHALYNLGDGNVFI